MNERIEQAAREIAHKQLAWCEDADYSWKDIEHLMKNACIKMANWALSHQWISVDEELPEVNKLVFGCVNDEGTPQAVGMAYYDEYGSWHYSDEEETVLITHWMLIPTLEGDNK